LAAGSTEPIVRLRRQAMVEILERPRAPTPRRFDIDAYYRMAEAGVLGDPRRVELIDGEIFDMAAIGSPHAAVTNRLARLFSRSLSDDAALTSVQTPLRLDAYNEPEPDVMLLRAAPTITARVIRAPPTFSSWSKSRKLLSPTIAA
jgi:Uma2 family endonuclease